MLPVAVFITAATVYLCSLSRFLSVSLAPFVAQAIGPAMHREVKLARFDAFSTPGQIKLRGLVISNHESFAQDHGGLPFLNAASVVIHYNLPGILKNPDRVAGQIGNIDVVGGFGYVERTRLDAWNFSNLIPKHEGREVIPYPGVISVRNATVYFRDRSAAPQLRNHIERIDHVKVVVDCRSNARFTFSASGASVHDLFETGSISGNIMRNPLGPTLTARDHGFRLHILFKRASASYLATDFVPWLTPVLRVRAGTADVDLTVSAFGDAPHRPVDLQGFVHVSGGSLNDVRRQIILKPATDVSGDIFFTLQQTTVALTGRTDGIPVSVNGAVFGFPRVELAMRIDLPKLPVGRLHEALPFIPALSPHLEIPSSAGGTLMLTGELTDPVVTGTFRAPSVFVSGYGFHDVRTDMAYSRGLIVLNNVTARPDMGGTAIANGLIDTRPKAPALVCRGSVKGIAIGRLGLGQTDRNRIGSVSGVADVSFVVASGHPGSPSEHAPRSFGDVNAPLEPVRAEIAMNASNVSIHGCGFSRIWGRGKYVQGEGVVAAQLSLQDLHGGLALIRGAIPMTGSVPPAIDMQLNIARVQIGGLLAALGVENVSGTGYFQGQVFGPVKSPEVSGRLSLVDVSYKDRAIDLASGHIRYHNGNVALDGMNVQVEPASARISGIVTGVFSSDPLFDVRANVNRLQLSDMLGFLPDSTTRNSHGMAMSRIMQTASGSIDGNVDLSGSLKDPRVKGDLNVADATVDALHFTDCAAVFEYANNVIDLRQMSMSWENAKFDLEGFYDLVSKDISAKFRGNGLRAENITQLMSSNISAIGEFAIAGSIRGTLSEPVILLQTVTDRMNIEGITIESVRAAGQYSHGLISSTGVPIGVSVAGGNYSITGYSYNIDTKALSVTASVEDQNISVLLNRIKAASGIMNRLSETVSHALLHLPKPLDGDVSIRKLAMSGTIDNPVITVDGNVKNLTYGQSHIDDLVADFDMGGSTLNLRTLKARSDSASVNASGSIDLHGLVNARLEASNINLGQLSGFFQKPLPLTGSISTLSLAATGTTRAPDLTGSATLTNFTYGSIAFNRIVSGQITIANRQLLIDGLTLVKDEIQLHGPVVEHTATVSGTAPLAWKQVSGLPMPYFPTNVPMALHVSIPRQSLSALEMFVPQISRSAFSGQFQADVTVGGTLANKDLSGEIQIASGSMQPLGFRTGLKDIDAMVTFDGNTATIVRASALSTQPNGGRLTASGTLAFSGARQPVHTSMVDALLGGVSVDGQVKAEAFKVSENKLVDFGNAGISGQIGGALHISGRLVSPLIEGRLAVGSAVIILPSSGRSVNVLTPKLAIDPTFRVHVVMERGARIDSSDVKVTDALGDFTLAGDLMAPNLNGLITIEKGVFDLPTAHFRIIRGGTAVLSYSSTGSNNVSGLDISVNMQARTSMSIAQRTLNTSQSITQGLPVQPALMGTFTVSQRYTITATITGSLKSDGTGLRLDFESDPPLATSQILAALGGQSFQEIGGGSLNTGVSSLFAQVLTNTLSQSILGSFYEETGLDVDVDYNPDLPLVVSVTRELLPRVNLTLLRLGTSRDPSVATSAYGTPQYQLLLGYNLKDRLNLMISADDQRDYAVGIEDVFRF